MRHGTHSDPVKPKGAKKPKSRLKARQRVRYVPLKDNRG